MSWHGFLRGAQAKGADDLGGAGVGVLLIGTVDDVTAVAPPWRTRPITSPSKNDSTTSPSKSPNT